MKIEMWDIARVKPYEHNPRKNEGAVEAVAKSIREFGFRVPLVVDADGVLIAGHTRLKAAEHLGLTKVPVHVAKDLSPEQARALRIADNKLHELSSWDMELLPLEIADLQGLDFDLSLMGFSQDELTALLAPAGNEGLTDPDDVPAPPDAATTVPGDIWVLGEHRLMCGDSGSAAHLDRLLDGQPIHLVNTDPPYNVKVEPRSNNAIAAGLSSFAATHHQKLDVERHPGKSKPTGKKMRAKDRPLANDFVSDDEFDRLLAAWFGNIARVLIPGGTFYIWGGYANCGNYPPVLKRCELYFAQAIIWIKEHPVLTRKDFMGNHEWCFYGWKEGAAHRFFGCGRNDFIGALRRIGIDGLGIDFAFPEADITRAMHKTGLLDGVADVVTSFDALEHLLPEDVDSVLAEMRRVGRPKAHFVFSICTRPSRTTVAGEGLHPTVRPLAWWLDRIGQVGTVTAPKAEGRYIVGRFAAKEGCGCA